MSMEAMISPTNCSHYSRHIKADSQLSVQRDAATVLCCIGVWLSFYAVLTPISRHHEKK